MKNLFFALAFMLVGTFAFANNEVKSESIDSIEILEESLITFPVECNLVEKFTSCTYIVQFVTSDGDTIATFTYTYERDDCSELHGGLKKRAVAEFFDMFT